MESKICKILFCRKFAMPFFARGFTPLEVFNAIKRVINDSRRRIRFYPFLNSRRSTESLTGFSVFEMVVVLGIVTLVSSVVLASYPAFNERLGVRRAAEDIASSIRQTQAYGLGVKEFGPGSGIFPGYGIGFRRYASAGVPADSYILYADSNNNLQYDSGEIISVRMIQGAAVVDDICCDQKQATPGPCSINYFYVEYLRPQPSVSLQSSSGSCYNDAEIKIKGSKGTMKTIVIWISGQVSIEEHEMY